MSPSLDIIIVNWNSGKYLNECLKSISATDKSAYCLERVVVVDNCSTDDSLNSIDPVDLPLKIVNNLTNQGFAKACNDGAKDSNADYLLFLNPDMRLFENSLDKAIEFMEHPCNSKVGVCGIQLVDESGAVTRSCSRLLNLPILISTATGLNRLFPHLFPSQFMTEWDHSDSQDVEQVIGAFFMVKREVFELLGGFDERFFVYAEEVDFCYRLREKGFRVSYLADVQAFHKGGGSSENVKAERLFYCMRSKIIYAQKHFNVFSALIATGCILVLEPISRIILGILQISLSRVRETIRASLLLYNWFFHKGLFSDR